MSSYYPSLFTFLLPLLLTLSARPSAVPLRRFLHQPLFFPLDAFPPSASPPPQPQPQTHPQPQPQLQPKQPFSSSSTPQTQISPFFPSTSSSPPPPPPPPPAPSSYLVTFPANISSLLIPTSPSSSSSSSSSRRRLTAAVVSVTLLSVALLFALSALFLLRYRRGNVVGFSDDKSSHVDGLRLVPPNMSSSDAAPPPSMGRPPCYASASSSSEFLYLGTLSSAANPYGDAVPEAAVRGDTSASTRRSPQKLGSPELRPLPPLPRVPTSWSGEAPSFSNNIEETKKEEEYNHNDDGEDQFFSPRGSSGHRESIDSPDLRRPAMNLQRESEFLSQFGNPGLNSRNPFYPYEAVSGSSRNSASSSDGNVASPQMDSSRLSLKSSSPEVVLKFNAPTHVSVPRAMPVNSPTLSSLSSSPVSETSKTPAQTRPIVYPTRKPPPPPPPMPPLSFWENSMSQEPANGPPVLITPSRPAMSSTPPPEQELQRSGSGIAGESNEETPRPKLKPLHWDKVRSTSDRAMVWDHIKSSSFQLNEEMIESLFVVNSSGQKENARRSVLPCLLNQENRVLDPKKSQNIAILLKALNVTIEEVCESLMEGNADSMGSELLESLLKMAPTKEEERKLKEFKDESPVKLGPAEKFLRALLDVPFAFKRVDAMLYITNFDAETEYLGRSFKTLKAACGELKNSKLFLKLLEAVLKTGNRMNVGTNRGDARAFKLDTLLKLVDIKGKDGKTTLLHFVVQEIARIEGSELSKDNNGVNNQSSFEIDVESRKLGLQVVSGLSGELTNVKKAATMDSCVLSNEVAKLAGGLGRVNEVIKICCDGTYDDGPPFKFAESMKSFVARAEQEIVSVQAEESSTLSLVRELTEYFHGDSGKEEAHPFRIFLIVKDFIAILDRVCKEVGRINERSIYGSAVQFSAPAMPSMPPPFFTEFSDRRDFAASRADGYDGR